MPEELDRATAAALARLAESWLSLGAKLDVPGMVLSVLAVAILLLKETSLTVLIGLVCVIVFGVLGKYFAMRVAFDRRLFCYWADRWESDASADPGADMARLDDALSTAGLRNSRPGSSRSLQSRQQGAFRLFRNQVILFLLQCIALLMSAVAVHWAL